MTYRSKYTGRYSGIGKLMQRPGIQRACRKAAVEMKALAEARSPVGDPQTDSHSGRYKASFDVVPVWRNIPFQGRPRWRASARLINTSPEARIVEYGTGRTPRYAVLSKTIDDLKAAHRA
jgi:hypothetical protein